MSNLSEGEEELGIVSWWKQLLPENKKKVIVAFTMIGFIFLLFFSLGYYFAYENCTTECNVFIQDNFYNESQERSWALDNNDAPTLN